MALRPFLFLFLLCVLCFEARAVQVIEAADPIGVYPVFEENAFCDLVTIAKTNISWDFSCASSLDPTGDANANGLLEMRCMRNQFFNVHALLDQARNQLCAEIKANDLHKGTPWRAAFYLLDHVRGNNLVMGSRVVERSVSRQLLNVAVNIKPDKGFYALEFHNSKKSDPTCVHPNFTIRRNLACPGHFEYLLKEAEEKIGEFETRRKTVVAKYVMGANLENDREQIYLMEEIERARGLVSAFYTAYLKLLSQEAHAWRAILDGNTLRGDNFESQDGLIRVTPLSQKEWARFEFKPRDIGFIEEGLRFSKCSLDMCKTEVDMSQTDTLDVRKNLKNLLRPFIDRKAEILASLQESRNNQGSYTEQIAGWFQRNVPDVTAKVRDTYCRDFRRKYGEEAASCDPVARRGNAMCRNAMMMGQIPPACGGIPPMNPLMASLLNNQNKNNSQESQTAPTVDARDNEGTGSGAPVASGSGETLTPEENFADSSGLGDEASKTTGTQTPQCPPNMANNRQRRFVVKADFEKEHATGRVPEGSFLVRPGGFCIEVVAAAQEEEEKKCLGIDCEQKKNDDTSSNKLASGFGAGETVAPVDIPGPQKEKMVAEASSPATGAQNSSTGAASEKNKGGILSKIKKTASGIYDSLKQVVLPRKPATMVHNSRRRRDDSVVQARIPLVGASSKTLGDFRSEEGQPGGMEIFVRAGTISPVNETPKHNCPDLIRRGGEGLDDVCT